MPWGVPVRIPPTLNRAAIQTRLVPQRCPAVYRRHSRWLTVAEWRSLGVVPTGPKSPGHGNGDAHGNAGRLCARAIC